jgi:hypothetical protein
MVDICHGNISEKTELDGKLLYMNSNENFTNKQLAHAHKSLKKMPSDVTVKFEGRKIRNSINVNEFVNEN